ncbi:MAG: hypothetical protein GYA17_08365 [Chloroflexi bacterium]|jgi:hypothetical protein|nr:hypothetical protein [Chloroflexota bacterium]
MATEQEKINNRVRMWALGFMGMTMGIWEIIEESSVSLSPQIGAQILKMAEKQLGLEIAGEKPEDVLVELGRIFVDEYGFAGEASVEGSDKTIRVTLKNAVGTPEFAQVLEHGVEKLFSHPFLCAGLAALARMGCKARGNVVVDSANHSYLVTFELL